MPISSNKPTGQTAQTSRVQTNSTVDNANLAQCESALSKTALVLGGYEAGFELVNGLRPDAAEQFTVISARDGTPRLFLPKTQATMQTALSSFLGRSPLLKLMQPFLRLGVWVGGPFSRLSSNMSLVSKSGQPSALRRLIKEVLGRNDFHMALRLSFGRPNGKTVAVAISDDGEPLCYVKIGSESMTSSLVAHESAILEQFEKTETPMIVPRPLYSGTWAGGHNVLITAPLGLKPLSRDAQEAHVAADALANQGLKSNTRLRDSDYWQHTSERVQTLENSNDLLSTIAEIEQIWGSSQFDFGTSHGDWSRANVGMNQGSVAAIDWERCVDSAPRGIDIAHFAISELSSRLSKKTLDVDQLAATVRQILVSLGLPANNAEPLVVFALLEMVIRFKSAKIAGLHTSDSIFAPALKTGIKKWAP